MKQMKFVRLAILLLTATLALAGFSGADFTGSKVEAGSPRARKRARSARTRRANRRNLMRRAISKRRVPARTARLNAPLPGTYPLAPDQIEVIEHNPTLPTSHITNVSRTAVRPRPTPATGATPAPEPPAAPRRRINTNIDSQRVIEIQNALRERGVYEGPSTGEYDEATSESMRRFQRSEGITATGYPTAHALKRLGLAR